VLHGVRVRRSTSVPPDRLIRSCGHLLNLRALPGGRRNAMSSASRRLHRRLFCSSLFPFALMLVCRRLWMADDIGACFAHFALNAVRRPRPSRQLTPRPLSLQLWHRSVHCNFC
jgi:hypothetical protein